MAAVEANEAAKAFTDRAYASLGHEGSVQFPSFAYLLLDRGMIEPWLAYVRQMEGPVTRSATPTPSAIATSTMEKVASVLLPKRAGKSRNRKINKLIGEPVPGYVRCVVVRPGYEAPDGQSLTTGDMVDLQFDVAQAAVRSGALEFASQAPSPTDEPSSPQEVVSQSKGSEGGSGDATCS